MYRDLILFNHLLLIISIFPIQSHATLITHIFPIQSHATLITHIFRQLAAESRPLPKPQLPLQISPSPSPSPAASAPLSLPNKEAIIANEPSTEPLVTKSNTEPYVNKSNTEPAVNKPSTEPVGTKPNTKPVVTKTDTEPVVAEKCDRISKKCHLNMVTACFGVKGSSLLILNGDDTPLKVNVTVLPENIAYKDVEIPRHQSKKINISGSDRGSPSIVLHDGNGTCVIHKGAVVPKDNINSQFPTFDTYITPINGVYVLFASALIIGGTWTCFKSGKGRHTRVDGIPYQELEMSQSDLILSVNAETAEGWDQSWDDWDEEKGVESASGNSGRSIVGNAIISRPNSGGWRNDWDD